MLALTLVAALAVQPSPPPPSGRGAEVPEDLTALSLAELAELEVTSLRRRPESHLRTPGAVHVITQQDLRRAGVTTLVEALRLVPGVHALRQDASKWAVGIRAFVSRLSRSTLVLVDGRSVYTPLFAGTYWEVQDTLVEDVERIEVISGPSGTLWGANAVNGIVNVITRSARDTHGTVLRVGMGNEERALIEGRWGGRAGAETHLRVFAKLFDHDASAHPDGSSFDDWRTLRGGLRADRPAGGGDLALTAEAYTGRFGQRTSVTVLDPPSLRVVDDDVEVSGGHLLARWARPLGGGRTTVTGYYDRTSRREPTFGEDRDTLDLDAQHVAPLGERHRLAAGAAYRSSRGATTGGPSVRFVPAARTDDIWSAFLQDEIALLRDRLVLSLGLKAERNDYSGTELQPAARVLWTPGARGAGWAAVSRSVRTPSRLERDLELVALLDRAGGGTFARLSGNPAFAAETVTGYEGGWRQQVGESVLFDLSVFHQRYEDLLSAEPGRPFVEGTRTFVPFLFANGLEGSVSGLEVEATGQPSRAVRLQAGYAYVRPAFEATPGSADTTQLAALHAVPRHKVVARVSVDPSRAVVLDAWLRVSSGISAHEVPVNAALTARARWRVHSRVDLAVIGKNLVHARRREIGLPGAPGASEVQRGVFAEVTWRP